MSLPRLTVLACAVLGATAVLAGCGGSPGSPQAESRAATAVPHEVSVPGTPAGTTMPGAPGTTTAPRKAPAPTPSVGARLQSGGATLVAGMVPRPGGVGFRGSASSLTVIDSDAHDPAGTKWTPGVLRVDGDNVVLDHVYVQGGVDFYGSGTLTIRDSIIEGDERSWSPVMGRTLGSHLDIRDSTIRYRKGAPPPGPVWNNGVIQGDSTMTIVRCDISGTPTGIANGPGNSLIEQNYIHDLKLLGDYPTETHNDGVQSYGGPNLVIRENRIDIRGPDGRAYDGLHQNGAVFVQPGTDEVSTGLQVVGNYLAGGGFALRVEAPSSGTVVTDNTFGPTTGGFGSSAVDKGVGLARWSNNVDERGNPVAQD